jgi:hypothetical protein
LYASYLDFIDLPVDDPHPLATEDATERTLAIGDSGVSSEVPSPTQEAEIGFFEHYLHIALDFVSFHNWAAEPMLIR